MIEKTILSNLIFNDEYTRKVLPFLDERYFSDIVDKKIYNIIDRKKIPILCGGTGLYFNCLLYTSDAADE